MSGTDSERSATVRMIDAALYQLREDRMEDALVSLRRLLLHFPPDHPARSEVHRAIGLLGFPTTQPDKETETTTMESFAELDTFIRSLHENETISVKKHDKNISVTLTMWTFEGEEAWTDYENEASASTFLEALEMAIAGARARRPRGVRGLLAAKKTKLKAVPSG